MYNINYNGSVTLPWGTLDTTIDYFGYIIPQASMNQDKDLKVEVRRGKEKKVKASFPRDVRLDFLACLPIYPGLAPA